jgi:hypothetical protein
MSSSFHIDFQETLRFDPASFAGASDLIKRAEGSSLRREDRKMYNEYFSVYYNVELSELLQILLLQSNRHDADGPIARRLLQQLKTLIQDLDAFRATR